MNNILLENNFAQVTSISLNHNNDAQYPDGVNINHSNCKARVSLYGGHVLSFTPTGHKDIFWLSKQTSYETGKAIRGGIPLCWPWFGTYSRPNLEAAQVALDPSETAEEQVNAGNHGFARQLPWTIMSINADEKGVTLVLVLAGENQHSLWPNAYRVTQTLFFGKNFKQTLEMTNLSKDDAAYSTALHSYFSVSNPANITVTALTNVEYDDKLTGKSSLQQQPVSCVGEIDRIYHSNEKMSLVDSQWQRKIDIISSNCQQWVLWNPGAELAKSMVDVHLNGEQEYVCLEAANTAWQRLPAGKTVTIGQEINVINL
ncbi:D-hexose-6-phosphate mutarotase [Colwellia echini]|uniref:Putative glucose-6-phosphate 1-epimerase n=1 Tax=Colwellia echini TaxID=1982103 RepID=A0ABY3MYP9_9GAMM|nr:D-hexose-6-phosphate mutarotase [Colwellia echini]TYK66343.1 D-hexose-6-phosphate mutarotase [Colwellia echini]